MKKELPACPVEITLTLINSRWSILILRDLMQETKRFGQLQRSLGKVSQKVLSSTLKDMEKNGLIIRKVYPEVPPKVEYSLSPLGDSLSPVLDSLKQWGEFYKQNFPQHNNVS